MGHEGMQRHLPVSWTSHQFSPVSQRSRLFSPSPRWNMSEFNSWTQGNWYALGSLIIQFAFLITGVAFARNFLKTIRAFQEQVGALLRLSITGAPGDLHSADGSARRSLVEASPYWLTPPESQAVSSPELTNVSTNRFVVARRSVALWLQAPMRTSDAAPWRRLLSWLQHPVGS